MIPLLPASSWPCLPRLGPSVVLVDAALSFYPLPDHACPLVQLQAAEVEGARPASEEEGGLRGEMQPGRGAVRVLGTRTGADTTQAGSGLSHHLPKGNSFNTPLRMGQSASKKAFLPKYTLNFDVMGTG